MPLTVAKTAVTGAVITPFRAVFIEVENSPGLREFRETLRDIIVGCIIIIVIFIFPDDFPVVVVICLVVREGVFAGRYGNRDSCQQALASRSWLGLQP